MSTPIALATGRGARLLEPAPIRPGCLSAASASGHATLPPSRGAVRNGQREWEERFESSFGFWRGCVDGVVERYLDMVGGVDASGKPDPDGKRFLFVVAANNVDGGCGLSGYVDRFPAVLGKRIDGVVTVGGMTAENSWWYGSCRGDVEVLAPAKNIFSATITGRDHYRGKRPNLRSGTSFAAPIISGIAALLLSERPYLTPAALEAWIVSTPSRIDNAAAAFADGKVAYVESIAPAPMISALSADFVTGNQ